ncbi:MAG: DUF1127 domain-containing protein [Methyloligellaceae bacterium]
MFIRNTIASASQSAPIRQTVKNPRHLKIAIPCLFEQWYERWRQRADLKQLNYHMLRDIGITREQAQRESSKPFWE